MYYNTVNEVNPRLSTARAKALDQENAVLRLFSLDGRRSYTPWEVWELLGERYAITSVRRAMTNLTSRGVLVKTNERREGPPQAGGARSYCWRLASVKGDDK